MSKRDDAMEFLYELRDYVDTRIDGDRDVGQKRINRLGRLLFSLLGGQLGGAEPAPPEPEEPAPSQPDFICKVCADRRQIPRQGGGPISGPCTFCSTDTAGVVVKNTEPGRSSPEPDALDPANLWVQGKWKAP